MGINAKKKGHMYICMVLVPEAIRIAYHRLPILEDLVRCEPLLAFLSELVPLLSWESQLCKPQETANNLCRQPAAAATSIALLRER